MDNIPTTYNKRPIWQWLLLYAIIGILVYGVIYFLFLNKKAGSALYPGATPTATISEVPPTPPTDQSAAPSSDHPITITDTGFPENLVIKAGDSVTWFNQTEKNVFIASDPHPQHTDYPALNLGILKSFDSATLVFPTAGVYKYHNHLDASQTGMITVE